MTRYGLSLRLGEFRYFVGASITRAGDESGGLVGGPLFRRCNVSCVGGKTPKAFGWLDVQLCESCANIEIYLHF